MPPKKFDPPPGRGGPQQIPRPPGSQVGGPAPWADLAGDDRRITIERIRARFAGRQGRAAMSERFGNRPSAVLAPFFEEGGQTFVIMTRRAWHMRSHTGQVSFPGGRCDPGETPAEAALREAHEEIALDPQSVEIIGELDHLTTITRRSYIVPFVAVVDGRPSLAPSPDEVDEILIVPVGELLDEMTFREERWGIAGITRPMHFYELVGDTVWGATARMLTLFFAALFDIEDRVDVDWR